MIPKKWSLKPRAFRRTKVLLLLFFAALNAGFTNEIHDLSDQDLVEILSCPLNERMTHLKEHPGIGDRLISFAFDVRKSLDVRWRSLIALGILSAKTYRWEIEGALESREWFMRNAGLVAILHDDRDRAIRWSEKLLNDPALVVRTQAVKNLILLEAQSRDVIWKDLYSRQNFKNSRSLWVRPYMAKALALWARPTDQKRFLRLLLDSDKGVQRWAIYGLEHATGYKVSDPNEPLFIQKQKWITRLSTVQI